MLYVKRNPGETIHIGDNVIVRITKIEGNQVQIGIDAPREVPVHRGEHMRRIADGSWTKRPKVVGHG
jgi:carbon storage regulator